MARPLSAWANTASSEGLTGPSDELQRAHLAANAASELDCLGQARPGCHRCRVGHRGSAIYGPSRAG